MLQRDYILEIIDEFVGGVSDALRRALAVYVLAFDRLLALHERR